MTDTSTIDSRRRDFIRRLIRLAAMAAGGGVLGFGLWDRRGPRPVEDLAAAPVLPDFSIPQQTGRIAVAHGPDRRKSIDRAVAALGGISAFIQPGDHVLIKVNAAFASPPLLGATTHPDAVAQVIGMCRRAGAARVIVTDNPINDPAACFALSGIENAVRQADGELVLPRLDYFHSYNLPGAKLIQRWPVLTAPLEKANKVIGLAPVKDHHRSGASMILKNWYGLLGGRRNIFHQQIHTIIAELAMLVKPTLVILDGTQTMMSNGPTGGSTDDLKPTGAVIAGSDPVAVDAYGAGLLGKTPHDLPHLAMAEKAGAGIVDYRSLKFEEVNA